VDASRIDSRVVPINRERIVGVHVKGSDVLNGCGDGFIRLIKFVGRKHGNFAGVAAIPHRHQPASGVFHSFGRIIHIEITRNSSTTSASMIDGWKSGTFQ
jgi:hypothetical protein